MSKVNLTKFIDECVKQASKQIDKHRPEVLAGTGVCLFITAIVHAVSVTPKACKDIRDEQVEQYIQRVEEPGVIEVDHEKLKNDPSKYLELLPQLTVKQTVMAAGKNYIMPALEATLGTVCIVCSLRTSNKRYAMLYSAYGGLKEVSDIYRDKVIETIGETKNKKIDDKVGEELVKRNYDENADYGSNVSANGTNLTLFMDSVTGRFFYYDINKLYKIASLINGLLTTSITGEVTYSESIERYLGNAMKGNPGIGAMLSIYQQDLPVAFATEGFQFVLDGPESRIYPLDDGRIARILDYKLGNIDTRHDISDVWKVSSTYVIR